MGKAGTTVSGLSVTEANYQAAVNLCKRHFGQMEIIVSSHMTYLFHLKSVVSLIVAQLGSFYDNKSVHIQSLEGSDVSAQS